MPRKFGLNPGGQGEIDLERVGSGKLLSAREGSKAVGLRPEGETFPLGNSPNLQHGAGPTCQL